MGHIVKNFGEKPGRSCAHAIFLVFFLLPTLLIAQAPDAAPQERPVPILTGNAGFFTDVIGGETELVPEINPVILLPLGDRWLIESRAEFKGDFERPDGGGPYGGKVEQEVDYLQVDYIVNKYVTQAIVALALMTGNIGRPGPARTRSPGSATRWGRACSATPPTCWAATTSPSPSTATRSPACSASTRRASRARGAGPTTRSWRGSWPGRSAGCGSSPPTPRIRGSTRPTRRRCSAGSTRWSCRTCTRRPRPSRTRTSCCPRRAGARRRGRSSTPSAASACSRRWRARPGEALADFHIFRLVAEAWGCGDMFARWKTPEDGVRRS